MGRQGRYLPCVFGSSGKQWRCAVVEPEVDGSCTAEEEEAAVRGRDLEVEDLCSIHEDLANDRPVAGAAGGRPYRGVLLEEAEEEGAQRSSYKRHVSERRRACRMELSEHMTRLTWLGGGGYEPLAGCCEVGGCQWVGS